MKHIKLIPEKTPEERLKQWSEQFITKEELKEVVIVATAAYITIKAKNLTPWQEKQAAELVKILIEI